jgi:predicted DsbA family dithiol-disulfide isomerase
VDAHRLVREAGRFGSADQLVDAIFRAHFIDGADIGNHQVLLRLAVAAGMEASATEEFLTANDGTEHVHAENLHAHRLGINGVPCFLIDGEHAIAGAQETEVLERLIDLASCTPRLGQ